MVRAVDKADARYADAFQRCIISVLSEAIFTICEVRCQTSLDLYMISVWPVNSPDLNPVDYRIWHLFDAETLL